MIHLSSYHSNGLPPVVWPNKVNLIGEKVYKPKIHFCESCNKPILIYGRLIPCKHVFCFTCASMCLPGCGSGGNQLNSDSSPATPHHNHKSSTSSNPNTITNTASCHRCGGRTLRVERNSLNSIFVCQIDSCKRTYLSARDLQAHITHRHSKSKSTNNNNNNNTNQASNSSASQAAISSSPYISSSTLLHMNGHNHQQSNSNWHRQSSSSSTTNAAPYSPASNQTKNPGSGSPAGSSSRWTDSRHRRADRESHHNHNHHLNHHPPSANHHRPGSSGSGRNHDRLSNRDRANEDIKRDRDNKEYLKQSLQRAAQWAEASAQTLEKGLTSR